MQVGVWHIVGILLILVLIAVVGLWSGRRVNNAKDFTTGNGKAGAWLVCGTIMGSLVGGQATVGTVQMAFSFGISAWWFTLGAGLGCIVLAIGYVVPLRHSGDMTLLQIIGEEYGSRSESIASVLCSVGIFISVISNVLAFTALLTALFPIDVYLAAGISVIVMAVYVIFGGVWGTGYGRRYKADFALHCLPDWLHSGIDVERWLSRHHEFTLRCSVKQRLGRALWICEQG